MKTDAEIKELVELASKGNRNAVDEIHKMTFEERVIMFKLIQEGKA